MALNELISHIAYAHNGQIMFKSATEMQTLFYNFKNDSNDSLNEAKAKKNIQKKELDKCYSDYRKDKLLIDSYLILIKYLIKYIKECLTGNLDNLQQKINRIFMIKEQLVELHKTVTTLDADGKSNAFTYYSDRGIEFIYS